MRISGELAPRLCAERLLSQGGVSVSSKLVWLLSFCFSFLNCYTHYCAHDDRGYVQVNIQPLYASSPSKIGTASFSVAATVPRRAQATPASERRVRHRPYFAQQSVCASPQRCPIPPTMGEGSEPRLRSALPTT